MCGVEAEFKVIFLANSIQLPLQITLVNSFIWLSFQAFPSFLNIIFLQLWVNDIIMLLFYIYQENNEGIFQNL